jgi:hypothetical protein
MKRRTRIAILASLLLCVGLGIGVYFGFFYESKPTAPEVYGIGDQIEVSPGFLVTVTGVVTGEEVGEIWYDPPSGFIWVEVKMVAESISNEPLSSPENVPMFVCSEEGTRLKADGLYFSGELFGTWGGMVQPGESRESFVIFPMREDLTPQKFIIYDAEGNPLYIITLN